MNTPPITRTGSLSGAYTRFPTLPRQARSTRRRAGLRTRPQKPCEHLSVRPGSPLGRTATLAQRCSHCGFGGSAAALADLVIGETTSGGFGALVDALHEVVARGNVIALQPEQHIRFARHRADLNDLLHPEEMRGHAGV